MKKLLSIILTFIFLLTLIGCANEKDKKSENSSEKKTAVVKEYKTEKTYKANAEKQPIEAGEIEVLTEEDRAAKTEIKKHSDTKVDFRKEKLETIGNKEYKISFLKVDSISQQKQVTYQNENNDIFRYKIDDGKLYYANIKSAMTEKTDNSIDITAAQKIAYEYVTLNCDINEYILDLSKETDEGYKFSYTRYICDYQTTDTFEINVGFNGEITYIINNTDVFEGMEISKILIDKSWVDSKIEQSLKNKGDDAKFLEQTLRIDVENGSAMLRFSVSHGNAVAICRYEIP